MKHILLMWIVCTARIHDSASAGRSAFWLGAVCLSCLQRMMAAAASVQYALRFVHWEPLWTRVITDDCMEDWQALRQIRTQTLT